MTKSFGKEVYEDFYVAYLDMSGNIIYPSDLREAKIIRDLMKRSVSSIIHVKEKDIYYKLRIKMKERDGFKYQIIELSNITEFRKQVTDSSVDKITHLNNRRIAEALFEQYIEFAHARNEDFSIILSDLDHFKSVNDTYGHINGDTVLAEVSRLLFCSTRQERYREQDIVARIGGDEFMIVMKNTSPEVAFNRTEKIRSEVENLKVKLFCESNESVFINAGTLSMGLYNVTSEEIADFYDRGYTTDEIRTLLYDRCDSVLYSSKKNGRNRVTVYTKNRGLKLENKD